MTALRAQLLGIARVKVSTRTIDFAPDKRYQCLAYLAYQGDWVRRDELAYLFWPEVLDRTARHSLRQLVKRVRKLDWLSGLEADAHRLRWRVETDVAAFNRALAAEDWNEAINTYGGPLLEGVAGAVGEFESWLMLEREHLHGQWREALFKRAEELMEQGEALAAAQLLAGLLEQDTLDEDALRVYMEVLFRAGRQNEALRAYQGFAERLRRELDLRPTVATEQLAEGIRNGGGPGLSPHSAPARPPAPAVAVQGARPVLPAPVTSFVGRDLELSSIAHHLSQTDCRLLTLTGPGGVGKSRLALQAAEELGGRYPDGVCFVPLEALGSAQAISTAIATAFGLTLPGKDDALTQLKRQLGNKRILLVLDNFEHLVSGAELVADLFRACPGLELLVTSRERLGLEEEWLLPIEGLVVPEAGTPLDDALSYDAVKLFVQRSRRVVPGFGPNAADLAQILAICRLVAGLPLGIELTAVWLRVMAPAELLKEMKKSFDFLRSPSRNAVARQQSLRAVFEHSWDLLSTKEQEILRKLSVFRGGFGRESALLVAGAPIALLAALVDKSLLRVLPQGRYDQHPLIYQYTEEKLTERPDEQAAVQNKHTDYYGRLLTQQAEVIRQGRQRDALGTMYREWENIHSVLSRSVAAAKPEELVQWVELMEVTFEARGYLSEGLEFLAQAEAALESGSAEPSHQAALGRVVLEHAWYCLRLGRYEQAKTSAERGLALLRPLGRERWLARGLNTLGSVALHAAERAEAERYFQEALALTRKHHDDSLSAAIVGNLAIRAYDSGEYEQAEVYYLEALSLNREQGRYNGLVTNLNNLGNLYLAKVQWTKAEAILQEGVKLAKDIGFTHILPYLLTNLSNVADKLGNRDAMRSLNEEALRYARAEGNPYIETTILANLSCVALASQNDAEAYRYALEAVQTAWLIRDIPKLMQALLAFGEVRRGQGLAAQAAELLALVGDHPATLAADRETAKQALVRVRVNGSANIDIDKVIAALKHGKSLKLEAVVADLLAQTPPSGA